MHVCKLVNTADPDVLSGSWEQRRPHSGGYVLYCVFCVHVDGVRTLGQCPDYAKISFGN